MEKHTPLEQQRLIAEIRQVAHAFDTPAKGFDIVPLTHGHINDTFIVHGGRNTFILQRINSTVFPQPRLIAENAALISDHVHLRRSDLDSPVFPYMIRTRKGDICHMDSHKKVWKAQLYIEDSVVFEHIEDFDRAWQIGKRLAHFHVQLEGLSPQELAVPLPGFHDLPRYLQKYDDALGSFYGILSDELKFCRQCVRDNRAEGTFFEDAQKSGDIRLDIIHGDPKVANILFSRRTGCAITLIDLDTVGPGLLLHDIGDCLRSCSCSASEIDHGGMVRCRLEMVAGMLEGYLSVKDVSAFEKRSLYTSLFLITFELGVRFITDYLQGNCYFKVKTKDDNLHRAMVQFALLGSIKDQQSDIRNLVDRIGNNKIKTNGSL